MIERGGVLKRIGFEKRVFEGRDLLDSGEVVVTGSQWLLAGLLVMDTRHQARGLLLRAQLPLGSGVGDTEPFALRVALGIAAGNVTIMAMSHPCLYGIAHTLMKERGLQSSAEFRNSCSSSKEGPCSCRQRTPAAPGCASISARKHTPTARAEEISPI